MKIYFNQKTHLAYHKIEKFREKLVLLKFFRKIKTYLEFIVLPPRFEFKTLEICQ